MFLGRKIGKKFFLNLCLFSLKAKKNFFKKKINPFIVYKLDKHRFKKIYFSTFRSILPGLFAEELKNGLELKKPRKL